MWDWSRRVWQGHVPRGGGHARPKGSWADWDSFQLVARGEDGLDGAGKVGGQCNGGAHCGGATRRGVPGARRKRAPTAEFGRFEQNADRKEGSGSGGNREAEGLVRVWARVEVIWGASGDAGCEGIQEHRAGDICKGRGPSIEMTIGIAQLQVGFQLHNASSIGLELGRGLRSDLVAA